MIKLEISRVKSPFCDIVFSSWGPNPLSYELDFSNNQWGPKIRWSQLAKPNCQLAQVPCPSVMSQIVDWPSVVFKDALSEKVSKQNK